jgi:hypothetical protein
VLDFQIKTGVKSLALYLRCNGFLASRIELLRDEHCTKLLKPNGKIVSGLNGLRGMDCVRVSSPMVKRAKKWYVGHLKAGFGVSHILPMKFIYVSQDTDKQLCRSHIQRSPFLMHVHVCG